MRLSGKVAVVTGGTRGIGRAVALRLAKEGADIAIIYSSEQYKAIEVCKEIHNLGVRAQSYQCDVVNVEEVNATVTAIMEEFGTIDILVNNAGVIRDGLLISIKEEDYDKVVDTSLKGAFNMIHACYYQFIRKRSGKIINMSSVTGICGNIGQSNYAAAKAGLIGLTKSVAKELAERNICCNAIAPGIIETEMTEVIRSNSDIVQSVPMKRLGSVEDISNLVAFLASNESDYITGEVIRVDGGIAI